MIEKYDESTGAILYKDVNNERLVEDKLNKLLEITSNILTTLVEINENLKKLNNS